MKQDDDVSGVWRQLGVPPAPAPSSAASYASLERTQIFTRGELGVAPEPRAEPASLGGTLVLSRAELGLPPAPAPLVEPVAAPRVASGAAFVETRISPIEQWLGAAPDGVTESADRASPRASHARQPRSSALRERVVAAWRSAPTRLKLTWALLPVALPAAAFAVLADDLGPLPHDQQPTVGSAVRAAAAVPRAQPATPAVKHAEPPALRPGQTLERAAADAVAEGNLALAAAHYRALAAREPERVAYRAALRILEARLGHDARR